MNYASLLLLLVALNFVSPQGAKEDACVAACDACNKNFDGRFAIRYCIQDCVWSLGTSLEVKECNQKQPPAKYDDTTYSWKMSSPADTGGRSACHVVCNEVGTGWNQLYITAR